MTARNATSGSETPLRFFAHMNEAACAALRKATDPQIVQSDFYCRTAAQILGCLQSCVSEQNCDLARIFSYASDEIDSFLKGQDRNCLKRALSTLEGVGSVWRELGLVEAPARIAA